MSRRTLPNVLAAVALGLLLAGCTTPVPFPGPAVTPPYGPFSHEPWDRFLKKYVGEDGLLDYAAAAADPSDLSAYLLAVAEASPDSHPARFPSEADRLAYWMNAYNAWAVATVLAYYPIASIQDLPEPPSSIPGLPRFFVSQLVDVGGRRINLLRLQYGIILRRFDDPRVHFALVSASRGSPRLSRDAFVAGALDGQLEEAAKRFVAEDWNVRVSSQDTQLELSEIFRWYERSFTGWLKELDEGPATLQAYVSRYATGPKADALARCAECPVQRIAYDWSLNDQPH